MSEFRFFAITDFEFNYNHSQNLVNLPITPFQPTRRTTTDEISHELNIPYTVFEILVAICAIIGNLMVIIVFQRERKLRRRTNYYIISLAAADLLVGSLGVPFAILASVGLPTNLHACLFTVSLLVVLCTISIFCLVAVSVDRYWAILYPMAYSRNVRTRTAIVIISMCWLAGTVVGFLPLFGWHAAVDDNQACLFVEVMDYNYLVFLYFATIITPALLMLAFYAHIYKVIIKQVRQIVTMNPMAEASRRSSTSAINTTSTSNSRSCHGGTMLRVLGAARKRDVKATQNLSIIVLFFMGCWIPLYTINCIQAFCPTCTIHPKLTLFCIILSHLNSAVNPILYAYHLKDFRLALKNLILRVMGIETETTLDAQYRYSMASQHRLQSMDVSARNNVQTRIYIDSPVWLRQQQQQSLKNPHLPKCGVVQPCLTNIHQTVAAVASVTADIEKEVWNIIEVPSPNDLRESNYMFPTDSSTPPTPPPRKRRKSNQKKSDGCDSPYSYDNRTFTPSPEGDDFEEVFLPSRGQEVIAGLGSGIVGIGVDHKLLNQTLIACTMREKLRSDIDDRPPSAPIAETDYEVINIDYQIPNKDVATNVSNSPKRIQQPEGRIASLTHTPPPMSPARQKEESARASLPLTTTSTSTSNGGCKRNIKSIYIIDSDSYSVSLGRKPKFRKSVAKSLNYHTKSLRRTCSCTSDTSTSPSSLHRGELKHSRQSCSNPSSSSSTTSSSSSSNCNSNSSSSSLSNNQSTSTDNVAGKVAVEGGEGEGEREGEGIGRHNNNSLNYFTFHNQSSPHSNNDSGKEENLSNSRLPIQQQHQRQQQQQQQQQEKFSPLKAMSNFIFPPIVKHSSLYQLFHPSSMTAETEANSTTITNTITNTHTTITSPTTTTTTAATKGSVTPSAGLSKSSLHFPMIMTDSDRVVSRSSNCIVSGSSSSSPGYAANKANESVVIAMTDVLDDLTTNASSSSQVPKVAHTTSGNES